jgi:anti-anti-sigma factor
MPIKAEHYNQLCCLTVAGDLGAVEVQQLRKAAEDAMDAKHVVNFVVDLEKCSFIDSEGLEALLWLKRRSEDLFGQVKLVHPDESIKKILEITRLEPRFEVHDEMPAALRMMH